MPYLIYTQVLISFKYILYPYTFPIFIDVQVLLDFQMFLSLEHT